MKITLSKDEILAVVEKHVLGLFESENGKELGDIEVESKAEYGGDYIVTITEHITK